MTPDLDVVRIRPGDSARARSHKLLRTGAPAIEPSVAVPTLILDAETEEPLMLALRYAGDLGALRRACLAYPKNTNVRSAGIRTSTNNFGYSSRHPMMQRYACRPCFAAREAPEAHETILSAGAVMFGQLLDALPDLAARDVETASTILPEWKIPGTPWTSGVLNTDAPLPYHYDRNNLSTWGAMVVLRRGVRGGHLHVPELGLTIPNRDGDVLLFPGWRFVHGVTPMHKTARDGYRFSAVFYTVAKMQQCLPADEELARARRTRAEAEDTMLERQRESGWLTDGPVDTTR